MPFLGELAALGTSLGFTLGPTFFALAGARVGSQTVNRTRLLVAAPLLLLLHLLLTGRALPAIGGGAWGWLAASGVVGLVLGDACLFRAFVLIGPRLTMLLYSFYPFMTAWLALLLFGERLSPAQLVAMVVTLGGVGWVIGDRRANGASGERRRRGSGIALALLGALGQALGLILARRGMAGEVAPLSAHLVRMLGAVVTIWLLAALQGAAADTLRRLRRDARARHQILGGALFGPILGVWLSLIAISHAAMGPASTLMALPPIFLLPVGRYVFGESVGPRAVFGTLLAVGGALALFLV